MHAVEPKLYHHTMGFAGQPDRCMEIDTPYDVLEIKTTHRLFDAVGVQLWRRSDCWRPPCPASRSASASPSNSRTTASTCCGIQGPARPAHLHRTADHRQLVASTTPASNRFSTRDHHERCFSNIRSTPAGASTGATLLPGPGQTVIDNETGEITSSTRARACCWPRPPPCYNEAADLVPLIDTPAMYEEAGDVLKKITDSFKSLDEERLNTTKPLRDKVDAINDAYKPAIEKRKEAADLVKKGMLTFEQEEDRKRQRGRGRRRAPRRRRAPARRGRGPRRAEARAR
jgi:hypothetical protein